MKYFTKIFHPQKVSPLFPSSLGQIPFENEALQFWKVFFDFSYYLLLVPFKFKWNNSRGTYKLHTNRIQQVFCLLASIFGGFYFILKIRQKYTSATKGNRNPAMYFDLAYYFCDTLYLLIMFGMFGKKGNELARVFDELQESNGRFYKNFMGHFKTQCYAKLLCNFCLFTLVLYLLEVYQDADWDLEKFYLHFEKDAGIVFKIFLSNSQNSVPRGLTFLSMFANCLEKLLNAFSDILFVLTVLMFRDLVKNFRSTLTSSVGYTSAYEALEHYRWLRDVTFKINQAMSLIIGSFIVGNLPFYATNVFDTFREGRNTFMRFRYIFYCTYFFPSIFLAAKASKEVEEIKSWMHKEENYSQIEKTQLTVVLHEIDGHAVGLSSFGCLTVSYGLFGSIVSIILTYALLKTQFQGPGSSSFPIPSFTLPQEQRTLT